MRRYSCRRSSWNARAGAGRPEVTIEEDRGRDCALSCPGHRQRRVLGGRCLTLRASAPHRLPPAPSGLTIQPLASRAANPVRAGPCHRGVRGCGILLTRRGVQRHGFDVPFGRSRRRSSRRRRCRSGNRPRGIRPGHLGRRFEGRLAGWGRHCRQPIVEAVQVNSFLPRSLTVDVAAPVTWHLDCGELLAHGRHPRRVLARAPLITSRAERAGLRTRPPSPRRRSAAYDGTGIASSGLLVEGPAVLARLHEGQHVLGCLCLVHAGMAGTVHVQDAVRVSASAGPVWSTRSE